MRYFLVNKEIFENKNIGMYGKLIYTILCKFANAKGECFPSRKTIAKNGSFSVSTYNKYISRLLNSDNIKRTTRLRANGSQTSNLFTLKSNKKTSFPVRCDIFTQGLSSRALCVYVCLAMYISEDNCCRVSQYIISKKCSMSLSSVIKSIKELKSAGLLETYSESNLSNNGQSVLLYRLTDGKGFKNTVKRKIDILGTQIENFHNKKINVYQSVLKRFDIKSEMLIDAIYQKHSPCVYGVPPKLYLY